MALQNAETYPNRCHYWHLNRCHYWHLASDFLMSFEVPPLLNESVNIRLSIKSTVPAFLDESDFDKLLDRCRKGVPVHIRLCMFVWKNNFSLPIAFDLAFEEHVSCPAGVGQSLVCRAINHSVKHRHELSFYMTFLVSFAWFAHAFPLSMTGGPEGNNGTIFSRVPGPAPVKSLSYEVVARSSQPSGSGWF